MSIFTDDSAENTIPEQQNSPDAGNTDCEKTNTFESQSAALSEEYSEHSEQNHTEDPTDDKRENPETEIPNDITQIPVDLTPSPNQEESPSDYLSTALERNTAHPPATPQITLETTQSLDGHGDESDGHQGLDETVKCFITEDSSSDADAKGQQVNNQPNLETEVLHNNVN